MSLRKIRRICHNFDFELEKVPYNEPEFYQRFHRDSNYAAVRNRSVWSMYAIDRNANEWQTGPNQTTITGERVYIAILSRPWYSLRAPDALILDTPVRQDLQFLLAPYVSSMSQPSFSPSIERQTANLRWMRMSPSML